jgi:hypothetical protein
VVWGEGEFISFSINTSSRQEAVIVHLLDLWQKKKDCMFVIHLCQIQKKIPPMILVMKWQAVLGLIGCS